MTNPIYLGSPDSVYAPYEDRNIEMMKGLVIETSSPTREVLDKEQNSLKEEPAFLVNHQCYLEAIENNLNDIAAYRQLAKTLPERGTTIHLLSGKEMTRDQLFLKAFVLNDLKAMGCTLCRDGSLTQGSCKFAFEGDSYALFDLKLIAKLNESTGEWVECEDVSI